VFCVEAHAAEAEPRTDSAQTILRMTKAIASTPVPPRAERPTTQELKRTLATRVPPLTNRLL